MRHFYAAFSILGLSIMCACQTTKEDFAVTAKSVGPGTGITWLGSPTTLMGTEKLRVGEKWPNVHMTNLKMESAQVAVPGRVMVINTIPSIDTPVCDRQTHILGETKALDLSIERATISLDLPYAQRRFVEETNLKNISFFSDYRDNTFSHSSGLQIQRNGLLARAVIVVDANGVIRHLQVVPEITLMPDMEKAFAVANELARAMAH